MNVKYSKNFERDFKWYLQVRSLFNFDGKRSEEIIYNKKGVDGKRAYFEYDSHGKIVATKHPNILATLLKTKGSVNLHIKMYAEDRAKGILPKMLFNEIVDEIKAPNWFIEAVENQKTKFYS